MELIRSDRVRGIRGSQSAHGGDDGFVGTAPVGAFPADLSATGALDMGGNVSEWTASDSSNPFRPRAAASRFLCTTGGSYASTMKGDELLQGCPEASTGMSGVGFRCAKDAE
jgi:formylglycine-generating enzyme required for sulfatase activity